MNVVLIGFEALRADHVSCYGYGRSTTPFIDALAAEGVLFENHLTPVVPAQPTFTTIFSGTHPLTHRIFAHETEAIPHSRITWLPLLMRHHGFTTVAIDHLIDQRSWFARGFEYYINPSRRGAIPDCRAIPGGTAMRRSGSGRHPRPR